MTLLELDENLSKALFIGEQADRALKMLVGFFAIVPVYLIPLTLIYLFFFKGRKERINSVKLFALTIVAWQVLSSSIGNFFFNSYNFRLRPFALEGIQEFLFERPQKSFPSDHAAALAAFSLGLFYLKYPRLGRIFFLAALVSSFARVLIGFHYIGDILGGFLIGVIAFTLLILVNSYIDKYFRKNGQKDKG